MAKLTKGERKALPGREFAGPGRTFPVNDRAHARAALMDAPLSERKGHISAKTEHHIMAAARRELGRTDKSAKRKHHGHGA